MLIRVAAIFWLSFIHLYSCKTPSSESQSLFMDKPQNTEGHLVTKNSPVYEAIESGTEKSKSWNVGGFQGNVDAGACVYLVRKDAGQPDSGVVTQGYFRPGEEMQEFTLATIRRAGNDEKVFIGNNSIDLNSSCVIADN